MFFAVYTSDTSRPGLARPYAGTIAARTGVLAEQGTTIRDGLFVGDETFSPYDGESGTSLSLPVNSTRGFSGNVLAIPGREAAGWSTAGCFSSG